jgi:hypothetical protein
VHQQALQQAEGHLEQDLAGALGRKRKPRFHQHEAEHEADEGAAEEALKFEGVLGHRGHVERSEVAGRRRRRRGERVA